MTSQYKTLRCAASIIYSIAGAKEVNGSVNAAGDEGRSWLDVIPSPPYFALWAGSTLN
jgi:hypothetical protein